MKISGAFTFDGPREEVWALLNDVEALRRAIPGCERLIPIGENRYEADLKLGLANIRGNYSGTVELSDQQPPTHYRMDVQGKGSNGFVRGSGTIDLEEQDSKTIMRYTGEAQIGGAIASVGQRLLDGAARTVINQSLKALNSQLSTRRSTASAPASPPSSPEQPDHSAGNLNQATQTSTDPSRLEPGLTTTDVVYGAASDFVTEHPYLRWLLPAAFGLLIGFLFGRATR